MPAVFAAPGGLTAHLVCDPPDRPLDEPALRTDLLARLPAVAVPKTWRVWRVVGSLPRLPNGKPDRRALH